MKYSFEFLLVATIVAILLLVVGIVIGKKSQKQKILRLTQTCDWYKERYLEKNGFSLGWGNYHLASFDKGKTWYAVNRCNTGITITGFAEDVFPGLVAHLEGLDRLIEYVTKNGPITFSNTNEIKILTEAGFSIDKQN